jgi:hypothetical protein
MGSWVAPLFLNSLRTRIAWHNGLVVPIYVPNELDDVRALLTRGKIADAARELWASLGSASAAALLEYLCLRDPNLCAGDRGVIYERCKESANRRHGFAQYALAWAEYERGNQKSWFHWLNESAKQRFLPALGDLALNFIAPSLEGKMRPDLSMRLFKLAIRRGHLISIATFLNACRQRAFGPAWQLTGFVLWPIGILLIWLAMKFLPFSESVFAYPVGIKQPPFK